LHRPEDVGDLAEQTRRILRDRHETPPSAEPGRVVVDRVEHDQPGGSETLAVAGRRRA